MESYLELGERLKEIRGNMGLSLEPVSYTHLDVYKRQGYVSEKTIYKCEDCNGCPYKSECIKGNNCKTPLEERTKTLQVAKTFLKHRKEDLDRILSEEGILFRTNRSIQAVSYTHLDVYKRQFLFCCLC